MVKNIDRLFSSCVSHKCFDLISKGFLPFFLEEQLTAVVLESRALELALKKMIMADSLTVAMPTIKSATSLISQLVHVMVTLFFVLDLLLVN